MFEDASDVTKFPFFEKLARLMGRVEAMYELTKACESTGCSLSSSNLGGAFIWSETPQGYAFWSELESDLEIAEILTDHIEDDIKEEDNDNVVPFCVDLSTLTRPERVEFIQSLIGESGNAVDDVEYHDRPEEWNMWRYVGITQWMTIEFWDRLERFGDSDHPVSVITPEEAIARVIQNYSDFEVEVCFGSDVDLSPNFPNFDFRIRNGNDPEVRRWLKDNGFAWASGDDLETHLVDESLLACYAEEGKVCHFARIEHLYEKSSLPEVITKVVTTLYWEVVDSEEVTRQERIKELEEELDDLRKAG